MESVVISLNWRQTLRSGRHLSTLALSSQNVVEVDGQSCNSVGYFLLPTGRKMHQKDSMPSNKLSPSSLLCPSTYNIPWENSLLYNWTQDTHFCLQINFLAYFRQLLTLFLIFLLFFKKMLYHSVTHGLCLLSLPSILENPHGYWLCFTNLNPCILYRGSHRVNARPCSLNVYLSVPRTTTAIHCWWPSISLELPRSGLMVAKNKTQVCWRGRIGQVLQNIEYHFEQLLRIGKDPSLESE